MCGGCLGRERRLAERALVKEGKLPPPVPGAAQDPKDDFPVAKDPKPGRCMYADCGISMSVDAEVSETTCEQCVRRLTATQRRLPGRPPGARNKPKLKGPDETLTQQPAPLEAPKKRKRSSPYPTYQCLDALLKDFGTRFHDFIEAQSYYFLLRGGMGPQPPAEAITSVVAADLDVVARKAQIELGVHDVKDAVARAGGLEFSPTSWLSILGRPGGSMQGELEVAKTIVRFRLVG
ncbi:hypothetical protein B0H14DRAFT_2764476 [Mycena olivaceomarginata]|nr:hypothetical protein B0H14DRAFT_2764476 [Mycena olivaceomarginata]